MKAGAESGWDFSSRWFIPNGPGTGNLSDISTRNIIPVDLNAFLQRNARLLSQFNQLLGNEVVSIVHVIYQTFFSLKIQFHHSQVNLVEFF